VGSHRKTLVAAAVPVAFLLSGALIWQASYAAFTDTTSNDNNSWTAGSVTITDDDGGSALFTVSGLVPGATGARCITVTYSGTVTADIAMTAAYHSGDVATNPLAPYLDMAVNKGAGASVAADCTGFTPGSDVYTGDAATMTGAGSLDTWVGSTGNTAVYRITYTLDAATPNASQGDAAGIDFFWNAQSQ
jgi:hypothetical protein